MKTMHGAFFLPCSNRSRTRDAPTPTNISTKSEPLIEKNGTFASPATARASSVLPVPGGPISSTPFGMRPPSFWNFCGSLRNSMISWSSSFASSTPATSLNVTFFCELDESFALLLPNDSALLPPLCIWRMKKIQKPMSSRIGAHEYSSCAHGLCVGSLAVTRMPFVDQLVGETFVLRGRVGVEGFFVGAVDAADFLTGDRDLFDLAGGLHVRHEVAERHGFRRGLELAWKNSTLRPPRRPGPSRTRDFSTWSSPSTLPSTK